MISKAYLNLSIMQSVFLDRTFLIRLTGASVGCFGFLRWTHWVPQSFRDNLELAVFSILCGYATEWLVEQFQLAIGKQTPAFLRKQQREQQEEAELQAWRREREQHVINEREKRIAEIMEGVRRVIREEKGNQYR